MRNHPLRLRRNLSAGLRSDEHDRQGGRLLFCENLEAFSHGLRGYFPVEMPFSQGTLEAAGIIPRFPFPQLYQGKVSSFLLDSNKVFQVLDDYSLVPLETFDVAAPTVAKAIPSGHSWHVVDMHETFWVFNGSCVVIIPYVQRMTGGYEKVLVATTVKINCGCYYKGRMLMGGFDPDYQFSAAWKSLYQTLADQRSLTIDYTVGLDKASVLWSIIGGGDLMFMFDFDRAMTGYITTQEGLVENLWSQNNPFALEATKRNDGGSARLGIGSILAIRVLGESVLLYGTRGIEAFTHSYEPVTNTPVFRQTHVSDVGLPYGGAVGGDHKVHCFVGTDGRLRLVDREFNVVDLNYEEFFKEHIDSEIMVSYDSMRNRFLVGVGSRTYVINFVGIGDIPNVPVLTWTTQQVTSVNPGRGNDMVGKPVGFCTEASAIQDKGSLKVGAFDFGTRGFKQVTGAELHGEIGTDAYLVYHYAVQSGLDLATLDPELFGPGGEIRFHVEGTDVAVEITFDDFRHVVLNALTIHRYYTDYRYSRGQNANTDDA